MRTNVIPVASDLSARADALFEAERFSAYNGLTGKDAMHVRLLTEETISMVDGIMKGFHGGLWLESEPTSTGLLCRICVEADVNVNEGQEEKLLDIATSKKNEESVGILGKIRQILRWTLQQTDSEASAMTGAVSPWYALGIQQNASAQAYWSLQQYSQRVQEEQPDSEAWDELEKSIIAKLADEVKVGIRSERAQVIIEKFIHTNMKGPH